MSGRRADPVFMEALRALLHEKHVGGDHSATGRVLIDELRERGHEYIHRRRIDEAVRALRLAGEPIASTSVAGAGYFIAATDAEEEEFVRTQIDGRIAALAQVRKAFKRVRAQLPLTGT